MVPRPLAPARAIISRTCVDVIQPCLGNLSVFDVNGSKAAGEATSFPGSSLYLEKGSRKGGRGTRLQAKRDATAILVLSATRLKMSPTDHFTKRRRECATPHGC